MTEYQIQANDFLAKTGTTFTATFKENGFYFDGDKDARDIYIIVLKNKNSRFRFTFGQSINDSNQNTPPKSYDVLASITKYEVSTFDNFCNEYGYDTDSRKALKTYKAVLREWKNIEKLFTAEQIEELQEIN